MKRISLCMFVFLFACDGLEIDPDEGGNKNGTIVDGEVRVTTLDATDETEWVHFDLDTAQAVADEAPWDLAFRRNLVATHGAAGVRVARVDGTPLDEVQAAPEEGYAADPELEEAAPEALAFHGDSEWYDYDRATHQLAPKIRTYVIESDEGRAFALQILDYYDDAGTSAVYTFRWKEVAR